VAEGLGESFGSILCAARSIAQEWQAEQGFWGLTESVRARGLTNEKQKAEMRVRKTA
jgi:hypothetical protein